MAGTSLDSAAIRSETGPDDTVVWHLDQPNSRANVFTAALLDELDERLTALEEQPVRGLVLLSDKDSVFMAGADLNAFETLRDADEVRTMSLRGQELFSRFADLPFPTVAAIHGAALGGGLEWTLACDWRIASPDKSTRLGLPETQLGILPAWGGCSRLPRLIGLRAALDLILSGKRLSAQAACKKGLVDAVVPREHLVRLAGSYVDRGSRTLPRPRDTRWPVSALITALTRRSLHRKTHENYPALLEATTITSRAAGSMLADSLTREQHALARLMTGDVFPHLLRLYFLRESAKKHRVSDEKPATPERVWVLGAGVMGAGIAQWHAVRGSRVWLRDINAYALAKGTRTVNTLIDQAQKRRLLTPAEAQATRDRIHPVLELPFAPPDLVIEAATERLDLKQQLFADLEQQLPDTTLLATNTSALQLADIARDMKTPHRLLGLHYFNPVARMPLIEVIARPDTPTQSVARLLAFVQHAGKIPVVVGDGPGFLVNRLLMPYLLEAGLLIDEGYDLKTLDMLFCRFGLPMGPARLLDEIGLDVAGHVVDTFVAWRPDRYTRPQCVDQLIDAGHTGRKAGIGFYRYKGRPPYSGDFRPSQVSSRRPGEEQVFQCLDALIREAADVLDEGLVHHADDVDLALVLGTGFAPFRGGPLHWADAQGLPRIVDRMNARCREGGLRFSPGDALQALAAHPGAFHVPQKETTDE